MTYKQFVRLRCEEKQGSLIKLSKLKRENPEEYKYFNENYAMACEQIIKASNNHSIKRDNGQMITEKTILEHSSVRYPDKTYEEQKGIWV